MYEHYRKLIRALRKEVPPAFPVEVRRVRLKGRDGYCQKKDDKFVIRINRDLPEPGAVDALLHEWAHSRAWSHLHDNMDQEEFEKVVHDAAWGVAYAQVYRVFEQFNNQGA